MTATQATRPSGRPPPAPATPAPARATPVTPAAAEADMAGTGGGAKEKWDGSRDGQERPLQSCCSYPW